MPGGRPARLNPMLAEMSDGDFLLKLFVVSGVVLSVVLQVLNLTTRGKTQKREIANDPLVVTAAADHISRREFESHVAEMKKTTDNLYSIAGAKERGLRQVLADETNQLRDKVDEIASDMAAVKAEAAIHTRQLDQMQADIKQLIASKADRN